MTTDVEVLLFEGFDELDAVGPYEVLDNGRRHGADLTVSTVTLAPTESVTASHGLTVVPDGTLGQPDLLVVPGGGWSAGEGGVATAVEKGEIPAAVAERHDDGAAVASVCTGAMILAEAGLLDGRPATTHHVAHEDLAEVTERIDARVVDDGEVLTAAGVTSGIDLALWLLERDYGESVARTVAREMEYERRGDVYAD
ncbi:AraC family transcriptional regulator [Halobacteriales archaeon QS_1_68_20]|nr:MAG: AraC family transcriptional regulator [Halobacteriales archaeon QS_1_68_20]